jgi:CTP synthase
MQIACRCEEPLLTATMQKVSMFCHVTPQQVMGVHNVSSTYHVPLLMKDQGLIDFLAKKLDLASVKITKELKQSGDNLSMRWKALTSGYVKRSYTMSFADRAVRSDSSTLSPLFLLVNTPRYRIPT